jgi:hypothetical protein
LVKGHSLLKKGILDLKKAIVKNDDLKKLKNLPKWKVLRRRRGLNART